MSDLQFNLSSDNPLGSDGNGKVFKGTFNGKSVAFKKLSLNCADIPQDEQHWEKLIKFRDEHLVQYHQCVLQDNVRYLVMELCQGSLLDYCRDETLDKSVASNVKATDIMWQIICAIDYLHRNKIDPGDLKLENVLFWKRDSKSRWVVVKLTGYGYNSENTTDRQINNNVSTNCLQLGCLFYSAASKNQIKSSEPVPPSSLTEIDDDDHKSLASHLIDFLINPEYSNRLPVGTLLKHPLFTRCSEDARTRLKSDEMFTLIWKDEPKLLQWKKSLDESEFPNENFDDLKDSFLSFNDPTKIVNEAFQTTPQLFSEYIWHIATGSGNAPEGNNNKTRSIEIQKELGKGAYGEVYKCEYTDGNGKTYPAACKKCKPKPEAEDVFIREIETLRKLNHLFVVKYLDVVEKDSKKFIVMELCEGSLKEYVEGKLKGIPKDSLDDKILIGQVALGLAYIHGKRIIHKDLKLENILLKRQSPRLVLAKIADFGFAKELKPGKFEFSKTAHPGTETYMAPELLNADDDAYPATFASDVYALGITIARIVLKGEHPFSSKKAWRSISMVKGLVPPNLQGFSWDLIDLILKLTDKDPGKRPEMILVLNHPYFVLTNERTKNHFVDQLWDGFYLLPEDDRSKQVKKIFNNHNFREWYHSISGEKPATEKEMEEMAQTLQFFKTFSPDITSDDLYPEKEYEKIIKEAILSEYDGNKFLNQVVLTPYRLYKLVERAPQLLVPYLSSHLLDVFKEANINTPMSEKSLTKISLQETSTDKNEHRPSSKSNIASELEWSSMYYGDDEELTDELWNIKYPEHFNYSGETVQEVIRTLTKCNVSERVWSALLNRNEISAADLLSAAVSSHSSNAPKVTEIILQQQKVPKEKMLTYAVVAALNEGGWAAEIIEAFFKCGVNPSHGSFDGYTAIHYAARNESRSTPEMMKLLLKHEGDPDPQSDSATPIHLAALNEGDYAAEILKLLLEKDVSCDTLYFKQLYSGNANVSDKDGNTPLHFAALNQGIQRPELTRMFLECGADPNAVNKRGLSPVHWNVLMNKSSVGLQILQLLLQKGGNPNLLDKHEHSPIHYVANSTSERAAEQMKILLENGGDANPEKTD